LWSGGLERIVVEKRKGKEAKRIRSETVGAVGESPSGGKSLYRAWATVWGVLPRTRISGSRGGGMDPISGRCKKAFRNSAGTQCRGGSPLQDTKKCHF